MTRDEIRAKVFEIVQDEMDDSDLEEVLDGGEMHEGISLKDFGDSLGIVETLMQIEEAFTTDDFELKLEDDETQNLNNIGELIDLIEKKLPKS